MEKAVVGEIFNLLELYGVHYIVCSPGSRNAVLLMAAELNHSFKKLVVVDERSAAFIGLGIAMSSRKPVALICTSGTAMLNYGPALAEAYYQGIPLIVISADRPTEWIDQDDSQTIRQIGPFDNFIKGSYDLVGDGVDVDYQWFANRIINEGLQKCIAQKPGPVQFNVHLDGKTILNRKPFSESKRIYNISTSRQLSWEDIEKLAQLAYNLKVMIVAGFMLPDHKMQQAFNLLVRLPNVVVMAETVSNLHLPTACYNIDKVFFSSDEKTLEELRPDIVISVGGALISRKLKEYLRKCDIREHWSIGYSENLIDCFRSLTLKIEAYPAYFLKSLAKLIARKQTREKIESTYKIKWDQLKKHTERDWSRLPWCDLKALQIVLNGLPEDTNLFLSNGTVVRYSQIIPYSLTHATYSNRGVSGIEGCTSTAIGVSLEYKKFTCLITGDMSFEYDLSALTSRLPSGNFIIIVLDNGGGDIFRFIDATRDLDIREKYLCVSKEVPVRALALAFGFDYYMASSESQLRDLLGSIFKNSGNPKILHLFTRNNELNSEILRTFLNSKI